MIKSLELRNWKAYDALDLRFESGATFIVARNGVGKTSIMQALAFGIFGGEGLLGTGRPVAKAIRGTGASAEAQVRVGLSLGDDEIEVQRVVRRGVKGHEASVSVNGSRVPLTEFSRLLAGHSGVDLTQFQLLSTVAEGDLMATDDAGRDVASMLHETFGVDRLRKQAEVARKRSAQIERAADAMRRGLRQVPGMPGSDELAQVDARFQRVQAERDQVRGTVAQLRAALAGREAWRAYDEASRRHLEVVAAAEQATEIAVATWSAALRDLLEPMEDLGASAISAVDLLAAVESARLLRLEGTARLRAESESARKALDELSAGTAVCPTCRRPMTEEELSDARETNEAILAQAQHALASLSGELQRLADGEGQLRAAIGRPVAAAPDPPISERPDDSEDAVARLTRLELRLEQLTQEVADASADRRVLDEQRRILEQNEGVSSRLTNAYQRVELGYALAQALTALADEISSERIAPLTKEVEKRWPQFWARDPLSMGADGSLTLRSGEADVEFPELSGGQRTLAQLLVRILAVQMATHVPFLILDEPLEHLDIRNRRMLASLLVNAADGSSGLRQVLVTTYEESVTRRLAAWNAGGPEAPGSPHSHVLRVTP